VINNYKAAFIIPSGAAKELTDIGWIFDSDFFVRKSIVSKLLFLFLFLKVDQSEKSIYRSEELIIDVMYEEGNIEQIYILDYSANKKYISQLSREVDDFDGADLFIS